MMTRHTGAKATPAHGNQAEAGIQKPKSLHSLSFRQDLESPLLSFMDTPAWMQVVERRLPACLLRQVWHEGRGIHLPAAGRVV